MVQWCRSATRRLAFDRFLRRFVQPVRAGHFVHDASHTPKYQKEGHRTLRVLAQPSRFSTHILNRSQLSRQSRNKMSEEDKTPEEPTTEEGAAGEEEEGAGETAKEEESTAHFEPVVSTDTYLQIFENCARLLRDFSTTCTVTCMVGARESDGWCASCIIHVVL